MIDVAKTFGANMTKFRSARGLTQLSLAELLGVSEQTVWYYENGRSFPKPAMIGDIARYLMINPWQLFASPGQGGWVPPDVIDMIGQLARAVGLRVNGDAEPPVPPATGGAAG